MTSTEKAPPGFQFLEVTSGGRVHTFLVNERTPDWSRVLTILRDEILRAWDADRETMRLSALVRFLPEAPAEGKSVSRVVRPLGEGWDG